MSKRKRGDAGSEEKKETAVSKKSRTAHSLVEPATVHSAGASLSLQQPKTQIDAALSTPNGEYKTRLDGSLHAPLASIWDVSSPCGGRLLDIDPIVSEDEQHVLLAYVSCIKIFASSTSLLVKTLPTSSKSPIVAFALSACNRSQLYIAIRSGRIEQWDWTDGKKITAWDVKAELFGLQVVDLQDEGESHDLLVVADKSKGKHTITAHRFQKQGAESTAEVRTLFQAEDKVKQLRVIQNGQVAVAATDKHLIIGTRKGNKSSKHLGTLFYTWRELDYSRSITSLDCHFSNILEAGSKHAKSGRIDVAVGTDEGSIFVYRDMLRQLSRAQHNALPPHASRLHWHRNAVGSVKWSTDGNYLISGGAETVLLIWQLDTGKKQLLPHLSANIESIVVSPGGSSYAIRLADNSVMILSTLELQPSFNITGIQLPILKPKNQKPRSHDQKSQKASWSPSGQKRLAITVSPKTSRLMIAVPATVSHRSQATQSLSSPYLQIIDPKSGSQISKQALVRTKVTDRNIGPEGNVIEEPNIVLMKVSMSGKWLATVDEWAPPLKDVGYSTLDQSNALHEQNQFLETHLKFWFWNETTESWDLSWRVDAPHKPQTKTSSSNGSVLDLEADPTKEGFVSVGDDGIVKGWHPKSRLRDGLTVRDHQGNILSSWSGRIIGTVSLSLEANHHAPKNEAKGKLAISHDGSVFAVAIDTGNRTSISTFSVHGLETKQLSIEHVQSALTGLGLFGKYLVFVGENIIVWDLVGNVLRYAIKLPSFPKKQMSLYTHLCIDQTNSTFAVVTGTTNSNQTSTIAVFSPHSPSPIFTTQLPHLVLGIVPAPTHKGFIVLNDFSEVQILTPPSRSSLGAAGVQEEHSQVSKFANLDTVFGSPQLQKQVTGAESTNATISNATLGLSSNSLDTAQHQQISAIWATPQAMALPPIENMFRQVAKHVFRQQPKVA